MTSKEVPQKDAELFIKNTPNVPNKIVCWNQRPCHRLLFCEFCRNRKRRYISEQLEYFDDKWKLRSFVTISFGNIRGHPTRALYELMAARRKLHRPILRNKKFISFIVVEVRGSPEAPLVTPHFHIVTQCTFDKEVARKALGGDFDSFKGSKSQVHVKPIETIARLGGYLMDQNYFKTIAYRPKGCRLITASRGFYTGKPKFLKHIHGRRRNEK